DRGGAPGRIPFSRAWARRLHALVVQCSCDHFQRATFRRHLKNAPHDCSLVGIDLLADAFAVSDVVVSEATATCREPEKGAALQTAMCLLPQFLDVQRIHQPMDREQHVRLGALTIYSLRKRHHPDFIEAELFIEARRLSHVARNAARVIDQQNIERPRALRRGFNQSAKSRSVGTGPGNCFIGVNLLYQQFPALTLCELMAFSQLVLNRCRTLSIAGIASVCSTTVF